MIRHFHTKVAGVSHKNENGIKRQDIIEECSRYDLVGFVHEDDNPHDPNAIAVYVDGEGQIGYLARGTAYECVRDLKKGRTWDGVIANITGDRRPHGVNIAIVISDDEEDAESIKEYMYEEGLLEHEGCLTKLLLFIMGCVLITLLL